MKNIEKKHTKFELLWLNFAILQFISSGMLAELQGTMPGLVRAEKMGSLKWPLEKSFENIVNTHEGRKKGEHIFMRKM